MIPVDSIVYGKKRELVYSDVLHSVKKQSVSQSSDKDDSFFCDVSRKAINSI